MRSFYIGDIEHKDNNFVYFTKDNQGEYFLYLEKEKFDIGNQSVKVFTLKIKTEFEQTEMAFSILEERNLFSHLIKIKTVGIKTAMFILNNFSFEEFYLIIKNFEIEKLAQLKGIGLYTAKNIITELQKVYFLNKLNDKKERVITSLTKLGFSNKLIMQNISLVDDKTSVEEMIRIVMEKISNV